MSFHNAYYSIIQFCPDRGRAESANIGVLLLCPDLGFIDAKTSTNHKRARRFFGETSLDGSRLRVVKRALEAHIREKFDWSEGLADLERFIGTRANDIQLTPPRSMKTASPADDLQILFRELVEDRVPSERKKQPASFVRLHDALHSPGVRERIQFDQHITIPVLRKEMAVPYVFDNAATNLIKPHLFRGSEEIVDRTAAELAVEGDLLQRYSQGRGLRLVVVASFPEDTKASEDRISHLFGEYGVRLVGDNGVDALVSEIIQHAH